MDDRKIVGLFLERSEQAVGEVSRKYGRLCQHIARGIVQSEADAQECVSDAYLTLWKTIPPEKPASLRAYLTRVLRNICYNRRDYETADRRDSRLDISLQELEDILPDSVGSERMLETMVLRDALNTFLRSLPQKDRYLFLRRYYYLDTCREISRKTGMDESTVSTRLNRLRRRLKDLLLKEGIFV